jgi:hypothetical protein
MQRSDRRVTTLKKCPDHGDTWLGTALDEIPGRHVFVYRCGCRMSVPKDQSVGDLIVPGTVSGSGRELVFSPGDETLSALPENRSAVKSKKPAKKPVRAKPKKKARAGKAKRS